MNLVTVRCNECGAPLETSDSARYLTCNHCGSQLSVQRTASSIFTEKLEVIEERTEAIAGSIDVIRVQNDIAQLDREWVMEREKLMIKGENGHLHEPNGCSVVAAALVVGVGLVWIAVSLGSLNTPGSVPVFGLIIMGLGLINLANTGGKAGKLKSARALYESRRQELQAELARLR